jgi:hypothetical protein
LLLLFFLLDSILLMLLLLLCAGCMLQECADVCEQLLHSELQALEICPQHLQDKQGRQCRVRHKPSDATH